MSLFRDAPLSLPADGSRPPERSVRPLIVIDSTNTWPGDKIGAFLQSFPDLIIEKHADLGVWLTSPESTQDRVILLCFHLPARDSLPEPVRRQCERLRSLSSNITYALVSDRDGMLAVSSLLSLGVHGFLSADLPEAAFVQAIVLISLGAGFFNASCFIAEAEVGAEPKA